MTWFQRVALLLCVLLLLPLPAQMEAEAPLPLPECTTEAQVAARLLLPSGQGGDMAPAHPIPGCIRYISQNESKDPLFCSSYWCSVEPGTKLDLNARTNAYGRKYRYYTANMCTRAAYAMALSYLGLDITPGDMSVLMNRRDLTDPYDDVTAALGGVERIAYKSYIFDKMLENYLSDPSYSPVYVYLRKPNGIYHAVLIVGKADEEGYYLVVDPAAHELDGETVRVYRIRFDLHMRKVINSTFRREHRDSRVVDLAQWHLVSTDS